MGRHESLQSCTLVLKFTSSGANLIWGITCVAGVEKSWFGCLRFVSLPLNGIQRWHSHLQTMRRQNPQEMAQLPPRMILTQLQPRKIQAKVHLQRKVKRPRRRPTIRTQSQQTAPPGADAIRAATAIRMRAMILVYAAESRRI